MDKHVGWIIETCARRTLDPRKIQTDCLACALEDWKYAPFRAKVVERYNLAFED